MTWNMFFGSFVPAAVAGTAIAATIVPALPYWREKKRARAAAQNEDTAGDTQRREPEFSIVGSVHSNNDSPCLESNLSDLFARLEELDLTLHTDPRGCAGDE